MVLNDDLLKGRKTFFASAFKKKIKIIIIKLCAIAEEWWLASC